MLHLLGSEKQLCGGLRRRELLQIGGIGALGLCQGRSRAWGADGVRPGIGFSGSQAGIGRAKACIFVFLFGSPPQHETFDPKPFAPREIQGELGAIDTVVPGLRICEGLPGIARVADRLTVVRSMTHEYPIHCCAYVMTGMPVYSIPLETAPRDPQQWPFLGSVIDYLDAQSVSSSPALPRNIGLPWKFCSRGTSKTQAGPYAAFLGDGYDPFWTEFSGTGTRAVPKLNAETQTETIFDPHAGIDRAGRFELASGCELPAEMSRERFDARMHLLRSYDRARPYLESVAEGGRWTSQQERAFSLIGSRRIRDALDVQKETLVVRDRYGMTLFGQSCLAARRLIEAGARFVSVFWDPYGPHGASVWDTHSNHFPRLRNYLLPVFDQSFSALIGDLDERGLLEETLVICTSEHGRTPQIDSGPAGGARHHWSRAYSTVFAGGGIARGRVVGETDAQGGEVVDNPMSPKDMQATAYGLLGYGEETTIPDQSGRPLRISGSGRIREELLG